MSSMSWLRCPASSARAPKHSMSPVVSIMSTISSHVRTACSASANDIRRAHRFSFVTCLYDRSEIPQLCRRDTNKCLPSDLRSISRGPWRSFSSSTERTRNDVPGSASLRISLPMLSRVLSRSDEFVPSSASFLPGFGSKVDEAVSREPSDSPGSTSGSPRLIAAKYSSGLFFQVKALPTPAAAGLEAVAELWDVPDRQVVIFPFSATSSLAVTDWRLAWPRRFPPTASLIRPKPDRASLIFPATLLKTVFLSASRSLGLSATLVAEPGGNAEYTAEPSSFLLISNSSSAGRDCVRLTA
ncbi:hypothetical protein TPAR_05328 [Tolypocladium paradoxum]|uniref:Uncharacterized protein n=1 Tax=Tolypocladium paradoxum TaxID=94208 RepID=A0A2S4KWB4_9HYPO|nr:hypothetical protein TPAR_05328 [Tolypocladium paradoxum]